MTLHLDDSTKSKVIQFVANYLELNELININPEQQTSVLTLPAFEGTKAFTTSGLCHVARQLIKFCMNRIKDDEKERRKREMLLGYKQNCLKSCAAVSNWTKFCEVEIPAAVERMRGKIQCKRFPLDIPDEFVKLEKEFSVAKKTQNAAKYFLNNKRKNSRDHVTLEDKLEEQDIAHFYVSVGLKDHCLCSQVHDEHTTLPNVNLSHEVKSKHGIMWPYLCAFHLTVADLLVFGFLTEVLFWMSPCQGAAEAFFEELPLTKKWFLRCASQEGVMKAVSTVWDFRNSASFSCCSYSIITSLGRRMTELHHVSFEQKPLSPKQMHLKIMKLLPGVLESLQKENIDPKFSHVELQPIQWGQVPAQVDPIEGELNSARAVRKREQIENMLAHVLAVVKPGDEVVDFCAGGGHLGIVIAYFRKDCHVTLVENKEESIERALSRIQKLSLTNISLHLSNVEYFNADFDVGVTLHACGSATDLVLTKCIERRASFVACPCCYGSIRASDTLRYPKSKTFSFLTSDRYLVLSHSADQTSSDFQSDYSRQGKQSMLFVDYDRVKNAEETESYRTAIYSMIPETCSPKNNIIVGEYIVAK